MAKVSSLQTWIDAGYVLFSENGLEAIQIEPLARAINLNKSGFYHYFGDRDSFLEALMVHHLKQAEKIAGEYHQMKQFLPDVVDILIRYKVPIMAQMQLVRNKHNTILLGSYNKTKSMFDLAILPFWAKYLELENNHSLAHQYFDMVRDMFYARLSLETYNSESITKMIVEAKEFVHDLRQKQKN
jgi:AcrR family transcriptional regulator